MEIVNETCYYTSDLEAFIDMVERAYEIVISGSYVVSGSYIDQNFNKPRQLRFGYYRPTDTEPKNYGTTYTSFRKKPGRRIGIVNKNNLPMGHALTALAKAADGQEITVPYLVLLDLAHSTISAFGGNTRRVDLPKPNPSWGVPIQGNIAWAWLSSFKLRYRERAKRGSRAKAKLARSRAKIHDTQAQIEALQVTILDHQLAMAAEKDAIIKLENEQKALREQIAKLEADNKGA